MKTSPVRAARLERTADGLPFAPEYGDIYHPRAGALQQARHVFLAGNGLPQRWAGREDFVVLETGFGLGNNFLATWAAWRADPARCDRLHFVSVERHPLTRADLQTLPRDAELAGLADELVAAWPPLLPNLHRLAFDEGRVQLLLAFGDAADWLPEIVADVDAVYLDGFAPDRNPDLWQPRLLQAIARRCHPGSTASTWSAARAVREGLDAAGFESQLAAGSGGKREITIALYAPAFVPRRAPPGRPMNREVERRALIVGGGLAGCAAALALAELGWNSRVIERHAQPATEGSGNPAGLFHGIVNPQDGLHARWNRAAALQARTMVEHAVAQDGVRGATQGLLRLEHAADPAAMRALIEAQALPPEYVQALSADEASTRAGIALDRPAWFYPGGGWVEPAALAASLLRRAGSSVQWSGGLAVHSLQRDGEGWHLLDAQGQVIDAAATVVLANAGDAVSLLGHADWPIESLRGQLSGLDLAVFERAGGRTPLLPVAGAGYVLPSLAGRVWFGATSQSGDAEAALRDADHRYNLDQLRRLTGQALPLGDVGLLGRVGWRSSSTDRLPVIGAVPRRSMESAIDQPRFVPRESGLFVFAALGSRGITWAALGSRLLASWVSGAPAPVEASLLEAVDPARFVRRTVRRDAALRARTDPLRAG